MSLWVKARKAPIWEALCAFSFTLLMLTEYHASRRASQPLGITEGTMFPIPFFSPAFILVPAAAALAIFFVISKLGIVKTRRIIILAAQLAALVCLALALIAGAGTGYSIASPLSHLALQNSTLPQGSRHLFEIILATGGAILGAGIAFLTAVAPLSLIFLLAEIAANTRRA